jgi:GNAT superfamily N-acetyltransferase
MTEIAVHLLRENDWDTYRQIRLRALAMSPEAFVSTVEEEEQFEEPLWRARMVRAARFVSMDGERPVGVLSVRTTPPSETGQEFDEQIANGAELFGLWVEPGMRGHGIPEQLVDAAARRARDHGLKHLVYWVSIDNGPAVGFASGYGFRPTDTRRPARVGGEDDTVEAAMLFPLAL